MQGSLGSVANPASAERKKNLATKIGTFKHLQPQPLRGPSSLSHNEKRHDQQITSGVTILANSEYKTRSDPADSVAQTSDQVGKQIQDREAHLAASSSPAHISSTEDRHNKKNSVASMVASQVESKTSHGKKSTSIESRGPIVRRLYGKVDDILELLRRK